MLERLREVEGTVLDRPAYHADSAREKARLTGVIWKLERAQHFSEPHDPAWQALMDGDWDRALRIFEEERPGVRENARSYARRGTPFRRLRVVERPVSRYLRWEMHYFRILAEEGFELRVIDAARLAELEREQPVPEVVVLGEKVLYQVRYDEQWAPCGARRITDPQAVRATAAQIAALWEQGEPLIDFFHREIAPTTVSTC
ncbi:hypothetical protein SAMN04489712_113137 [Thermomonospora echinospora]|uniref:DUF6879 domain-containing protein n=1 Tax=Thermomonospora echinospora TaxID=1992 RepID=A0A1H6D6J7_9ACTN|nr:DUF6879 family protein [Thermomonospora echinospora]SEG80714.1 hypothetical protein SAMN04489712_113137 [Thermomonospora echinospora]